MRAVSEIKDSEAMANFIARPRLVLGVTILIAGMTLLVVDAMGVIYK